MAEALALALNLSLADRFLNRTALPLRRFQHQSFVEDVETLFQLFVARIVLVRASTYTLKSK